MKRDAPDHLCRLVVGTILNDELMPDNSGIYDLSYLHSRRAIRARVDVWFAQHSGGYPCIQILAAKYPVLALRPKWPIPPINYLVPGAFIPSPLLHYQDVNLVCNEVLRYFDAAVVYKVALCNMAAFPFEDIGNPKPRT